MLRESDYIGVYGLILGFTLGVIITYVIMA